MGELETRGWTGAVGKELSPSEEFPPLLEMPLK